MTISLSLLVIRCSDLEVSKSFYEALGLVLVPERHESGPMHWSSHVGETVIELYPAGSAPLVPARLGFHVVDVRATVGAALAKGGRLLGSVDDARTVVTDPDGNRIELTPSRVDRARETDLENSRLLLPESLEVATKKVSQPIPARQPAWGDEALADEWRQLGFFYESDDQSKRWVFRGSRAGLLRFADLLDDYVRSPGNAAPSEHEHFGPYSYLKIMTWHERLLRGDVIAGSLDDLAELADIWREKLVAAAIGDRVVIRHEFEPNAQYFLVLHLENDDFDPASADSDLSPASG